MEYEPVLEITRGDIVESIHHGAVAVADAEGDLIAWWGEPKVTTYLRSSAKPFQALPLVETGASDAFGLTAREIAIVCASHSGTDDQVEAVLSLQRKAGVSESMLLCGVHPPYDADTAKRMMDHGQEFTSNRHNCSGKHSGMLALARHLRASLEDYVNPLHPVQQRILEAFAEMCCLPAEEVMIGTDGCSAPNFAVPLRAAATAFARLADPSRLPAARAKACRRIFEAMTCEPDMVGGPGQLDTLLMTETKGHVLSKGGAEGYQGLALVPGAITAGSPALGVAIKIADGDLGKRATRWVTLAVLQSLGVLGPEDVQAIAGVGSQEIKNLRGLTTGQLRPCFRLERSS